MLYLLLYLYLLVHLHLTKPRLRSYNLLIIFDRIHICKTLKYSNQSDNSLRVLRFDRLIADWSFENMNPIVVPYGMSLDESVSFNILSVADQGCCNCCIVVDCILTVLESWWTVLESCWTVLSRWLNLYATTSGSVNRCRLSSAFTLSVVISRTIKYWNMFSQVKY